MTPEQLSALLLDLARGRGRERAEQVARDLPDLPALLTELAGRGDPLPADLHRDDLELAMADLLVAWCTDGPRLARAHRMLAPPPTRRIALDALAELGRADSVPALIALLADPGLSDVDMIRVVSALGEIGGARARGALLALSRRDLPAAVWRELRIALS
ncbi:HEAT repeat domain-containing protein [Kutzneria albida]|uniref:Uncharacterized protein n=1 Tax=Kutzneria albida DSM 43870 TaxID=1449976 RepID=W5WEC2_9PSEU|nr:HEAT repeat domain-containing protein [Kutzneria albida]AHH99538.1 hypothetical protein KALB_6178 [Kutzneria albida DSM 43870]